jgi:hypothetical protein
MKAYEKRIMLEGKLKHAEYNFTKLNSKVENQKRNIAILKQRHSMIETEEASLLQNLEDDKAIFFDIMKECKKQLKAFKNKGKVIPIPEPIPEPIIVPKESDIIEGIIKETMADITEKIEQEQVEVIREVKAAISSDNLEIVEGNKVRCPECLSMYTKGGAFASHYKSHFPNGD